MPAIQLGPVEDDEVDHRDGAPKAAAAQETPSLDNRSYYPPGGGKVDGDSEGSEKEQANAAAGSAGPSKSADAADSEAESLSAASSPAVDQTPNDSEHISGEANPRTGADDGGEEEPVPGTEALHDAYWNEEEGSASSDGASLTSEDHDEESDDDEEPSASSDESSSDDSSDGPSDSNVESDTGDDNPTDTDPESLLSPSGDDMETDSEHYGPRSTNEKETDAELENFGAAETDSEHYGQLSNNEKETDSEFENFDAAPVGAVVVPHDDEDENGIEGIKDDQTNLTRDVDASGGISGVTEMGSIEEEAEKRHWRHVVWLSAVLVGTIIIIAALVGGLVGALYFNRTSPAVTYSPSSAPTPRTSLRPPSMSLAPSTAFPTPLATETVATTLPPTAPPTAPTTTPTTTPTTAPTTTPTTSPTPTASTVAPSGTPSSAPSIGRQVNITNESLFSTIANLSADGGAAILRAGTPQSRAFLSVQAEADQLGMQSQQAALSTQSQLIQRYALRTFYYSTNGPVDWINRTGWENSTLNECLWYSQPPNGATMCNAESVVQVLGFQANGVTGELPPELSMLVGLTSLSIQGVEGMTGLNGGIPTTLASLTGMTDLVLQHHKFTEAIPTGLWNAWLGANVVTIANCNAPGMLPDISSLPSASSIDLSGNRLRGFFPAGLSNSTSLLQLNVANNKLRGSLAFDSLIPTSIKLLNATSNFFTGTIPSSVGSLTTLKQGLDLSHNRLSGTIPPEMTKLINLKQLVLSFNILTGPVPELANLTRLSVLALEGNNVTGTISNATCNALLSSGTSVTADCNSDGSGPVVCPCCTECCLHVLGDECQWSPAT